MEVYDTGKHLTDDEADIATFWDDNPFKVNINGHTMFATKRFLPAGIGSILPHWFAVKPRPII